MVDQCSYLTYCQLSIKLVPHSVEFVDEQIGLHYFSCLSIR